MQSVIDFKMQKLGFPSMKTLDQFKSLSGSAKNFSFNSRPSTDSTTSGSFANLKITAEKLVKEQASVKTDLGMANTKLKKSMEHIHVLEDKLQNAFNENAKLKVKQKEDEKLWKGLESKFSSTKTLCDQLTETLQHLAGQVQDAEKDKEFFEGKLSASSNGIDYLNQQLNDLSVKLGSAEETIRTRERELQELEIKKEERNKIYIEELRQNTSLIEEKDAMLKKFETTVAANRLATEDLNSKLEEMNHELRMKGDKINSLMTTQENLAKEKSDHQSRSNDFANRLAISLQEIKNLEGFLHVLAAQLVELDKQSLTFTTKFDQLNSLYDSCFKLAQQERELAVKHVQRQYDQLHDQSLSVKSEKDAMKLVNKELNDKIIELQKSQESIMAQLSEESQSAKERIQSLESEAEMLMSKKKETEMLVSKLEEKIDTLSEGSRSSENKMQDLLLKISALEIENKDNAERLQDEIQRKEEEIDSLRKESEKHEQHLDSLEKQVCQLHSVLEEKEQLIVQNKEREKKLGDQITENQALMTAAESKLMKAKKQHDMMLESKQLELSRHLKEISQRNDEAINNIRKKYEMEKLEIVNMEKEKADKIVLEMERKCDQKLVQCKEESRRQMMCVQGEHAALVLGIQQERDRKEISLKATHSEELKCAQLQAENELREKIIEVGNEHEVQMKALRCQHEDECGKLQEELDLQKSKEDRQRALLHLQWKVMSDKPQEDPEVNSKKKEYSVSSVKMRGPGGAKRSHNSLGSLQNEKKDSLCLKATQTPVTKLLKKVETPNSGSVMVIPKHHKKVTRHEYEVETNNGRTITKRRKTKSTVMFEDPRKHERTRTNTPKARTPRSVAKGLKGGDRSHPSTIGDLFMEGSLNPYADDPYAFG
ncbi:synaptonemal complex protein 1-like [Populus alba x Populus x berolinensis]|uniref:Synaptonemal complex protein 1-like n=3 Tax=Populus alba x Populus x berolinensis TaxID=444605 RepID=A0AAD6RD76_9ROSI|nr:synaptonemal complex protein 1-like [Populus alba x Populus x berolinensis]